MADKKTYLLVIEKTHEKHMLTLVGSDGSTQIERPEALCRWRAAVASELSAADNEVRIDLFESGVKLRTATLTWDS